MDYVPSIDENVFGGYDYAMEKESAKPSLGQRVGSIKTAVLNWFQSKIQWIQTKLREAKGEHKTLFGALLGKFKSLFNRVKASDDPDEIVEIQGMAKEDIAKLKGQITKRNGYDNAEDMLKDKRNKVSIKKQQQMREEGAKKGVSPELKARRDAYVAQKNAAGKEESSLRNQIAAASAKTEADKRREREERNQRGITRQASINASKAKKGVNPELLEKLASRQGDLKKFKRRKAAKRAAETRKRNAEMAKRAEDMGKQRHDAQIHQFVVNRESLLEGYDMYDDDFALESALFDGLVDETDLALEAALDEYYQDPAVAQALENMQMNIDINCTDDNICLEYFNGLDEQVEKFNRNLRTLQLATENYQYDGNEDALKATTGPAIEQLQATYNALGFVSESGKFDEACIEQLNQFFTGADDIMYNKALEFVDDADLYDEDEYGYFDEGYAPESFLESLTR